jgi:hypothetical protein
MRPCDLCQTAAIARVALLRGRPEDRIWLCPDCFRRYEDHELEPTELLSLVRLTTRRRGKCDWCGERDPATQARVPGGDGQTFTFLLCGPCAAEASEQGGSVLHGQAALEGDTTNDDPRYEHALDIERRRRQIRRIK